MDTPEHLKKQDADTKSHLMKIIETFKEDIENFLEEIQQYTGKQMLKWKQITQRNIGKHNQISKGIEQSGPTKISKSKVA